MEVASLVDLTIESCSSPGTRIDDRVSSWLTRARRDGRLEELEARVERWKREPTGVIATAVVHKRAWIREHRWFGKPTKITIDRWNAVNETKEYFWPNRRVERCDAFINRRQYWMAAYGFGDFSVPPEGLDKFLLRPSLSTVNSVFERYLPKNLEMRF